MTQLKKRVYEILDIASGNDRFARYLNLSIMLLIMLNVAAVILETVKAVHAQYAVFFKHFETVSVIIFTIEYLLRLWSCNSVKQYSGTISGRIKFAFTPMALIDIAAIIPFYLPFVFMLDLRFLRAVRLMRLFRLLKMGRYSRSLKMLVDVFQRKIPELLISLFLLLLLLVFASGLMYYFENEIQPEQFSSIPAAMWWGASTLTTVGYGDIYPITLPGKFFGAVISIIGIGIFALPAGILASGLIDEIHKKKHTQNKVMRCPRCGKKIR